MSCPRGTPNLWVSGLAVADMPKVGRIIEVITRHWRELLPKKGASKGRVAVVVAAFARPQVRTGHRPLLIYRLIYCKPGAIIARRDEPVRVLSDPCRDTDHWRDTPFG